ncbi:hypothetical protein L861_03070 [Litchfieldella anticariensis FP35 = DSM 16096]|uniref:DUF2909 domain-containing protein n=1 Tax=Litchfieldella anticariensis (strain DSM 16096 / CECT 5854 / CIP 108499 / LMG 22089 / FP35) TaxID=1121939 RepID=S2LI47_LITA3|nr:DUF2909 family protein [Halomonas anticariensis]EPC04316.1 hypothetical protein L861_03070 [Halomonas anticariensis FP35 = DSM 16096]
MLKALIALVFLAMLTSLAAGAGFLLRDHSRSRRVLISLKVRVALASLLIALLLYGFYLGDLGN